MYSQLSQAATSSDHNFSKRGDTPQHSGVVLRETPQKNKLHVAAKLKQVEDAKNIIAEDSSLLHQTNSKHDTPLHIAARVGCLEMAQLLIESAKKDQDVEADKKLLRMVNVRKDTALHDAVRNGHFEIVKLLIDEDSHLVSLENVAGESALFLAVDRRYFRSANYILQKGPCSYRGRNGMNVMHAAVIRTAKDYLINNLKTTFMEYVYFNRTFLQICLRLIDAIMKPKETNKLGCTGIDLIEEVMKKCPSMILEADEFGWNPLHYAAHLGHVKAFKLFLNADNSLAYIKDREGMFAIHIAARKGHVDVMKKLISTRPDASELLDGKGRTALHVAAESGKDDAVKYILKTPHFDDLINGQDKEGNTALMLAGVHGHFKIAYFLAKHRRVDNRAVNLMGLAAIDIILSNTEMTIAQKFTVGRKLEWTSGLATACLEGAIKRVNTETKNATQDGKEEPDKLRLKDIAQFDVLVATIIATVTFAACFNMPGGYEQDSTALKGMAVLTHNEAFPIFLISDALAFFCSAMAIIFHFVAVESAHEIRIPSIRTARTLTYISIASMTVAFVSGTTLVLRESNFLTSMIRFLFYLVGCLSLFWLSVKALQERYSKRI